MIIPMTLLRTLAVISLLGATFAATAVNATIVQADEAFLKAMIGNTGLTSLNYAGTDLLSNGDLKVERVVLTDSSGATRDASASPIRTRLDKGGTTVARTYAWGSVDCTYSIAGSRVSLTIHVQNTTEAILTGLSLQPVELKFPQAPVRWVTNYAYFGANRGDPTVEFANYGSGALAVCNDDITRPLLVGFPGRASLTVRPIYVCTANFPGYLSPYLDRYLNRPIAARGSDTFRISIRFGPSGDGELDLGSDLYHQLAAGYPSRLHWSDRRAIGTLHLAASEDRLHSASNPRGWFADPSGVNVTTTAGVAAFQRRVLKYADDSVAILKKMNAQGMITWDIEGEQYPQSTTYIGDPRLLKDLAPEMDGIADAYFKRFRDAGIRTGLCIRPQRLARSSTGATQAEVSGEAAAIAALLFDKISYANRRWGCSIFYVDSNGDPNVPYDPSIFEMLSERLSREKISALVLPEHRNARYFACTAPYASLAHNVIGTPDTVRLAYPNAFLALYVPDRPIGADRDALIRAVRAGDILLFRAWWDDPVNAEVASIYREAIAVKATLR